MKKKKIYFFDDNVNHILQPKRHGFSVYLTTWGYSTKEFSQIAKKNKITVLNNIKMFNFYWLFMYDFYFGSNKEIEKEHYKYLLSIKEWCQSGWIQYLTVNF